MAAWGQPTNVATMIGVCTQREWHGYFWGGMAWYNGIKDNVVSCFDSRRHEGRVSVMIMAMTKCLRSLYVVSDDLHVTTEILTSFPDLV